MIFAPKRCRERIDQAAEIPKPLLAPELLLPLAFVGQLFAETRSCAEKPNHQLIRKIFDPFHTD